MPWNKWIASPCPVNPAGFVAQRVRHESRVDVHCLPHPAICAGVAVNPQKNGVVRINPQNTLVLDPLAYQGYDGVGFRSEYEQQTLTFVSQP